jgi:proteic killer suppression protein
MKIRGFRHKGLKRLYEADEARGVRVDLASKLKVILHAIEQARRIEQVAMLPGWRLHPLKGGRRGEWSLWVTGNFRLTFRVDGGDVSDLNLEDYH